ncbi:MAG: hypothetical protein K9I85_04590 [Saprospiraceae bacterium]|nr:hypothetical protein [Saprospiraceae bacterium]
MIRFLLSVVVYMLFVHVLVGQTPGCTDPLAKNYQPMATVNDGSCMYVATSVAPDQTYDLPATVAETSGLIRWNGTLWTHNDDSDTQLFALEEPDGDIIQECLLTGVINQDWEDIDQDESWIYIGDFGNNNAGNRQNLHILRVEKATLCSGQPKIDTLWFQYEDQTDFGDQGSNTTDFDCEAMVVGTDSIYLFTKQWTSLGTAVYTLPKQLGDHEAKYKTTYPVNGLITGATWLEDKNLLALCGYSPILQPFLFLCYDYSDTDFFSGNKRRLELTLPFHQIEGITTADGLNYALTNERFTQVLMVPQRLHEINLNAYLEGYLDGQTSVDSEVSELGDLLVSTENGAVVIQAGDDWLGQPVQVVDLWGRVLVEESLRSSRQRITILGARPAFLIVQVGSIVQRVVVW